MLRLLNFNIPTFEKVTEIETNVNSGKSTLANKLGVAASATWSQFAEAIDNTRTQYYNSGYSAGDSSGYSRGSTDGYNSGYSAGSTDGYNSGYSTGSTVGYNSGYSAGNTDGYNSGYSAGDSAGYSRGSTDGYNSGYTAGDSAGYSRGLSEVNTKITEILKQLQFAHGSTTRIQALRVLAYNAGESMIQVGDIVLLPGEGGIALNYDPIKTMFVQCVEGTGIDLWYKILD